MRNDAILPPGAALLAIIALPLLALPAAADQFLPIGARQRALGGAGVAASEDGTAIYWNPANMALLPLNRPPSLGEEQPSDATGSARPRGEDDEEPRPHDRWSGYDTFFFDLVANADLKLTGDIVSRFDQLDKTANEAQAAFNRINQNPPNVTQSDLQIAFRFIDQLNGLNQGGDALGSISGGFFARWRWIGIGVYTNTYATLEPHVDLTRNLGVNTAASANQIAQQVDPGATVHPTTPDGVALQAQLVNQSGMSPQAAATFAGLAEQSGANLADPTLRDAISKAALLTGNGTGDSFFNNTTGGQLRALSTQELAIGLAPVYLNFDWIKLSVGVTPKLMHGVTFQEDIQAGPVLENNESFGDVLRAFRGSRRDTWQFGIDAGATIELASVLRVGVVGRNLNTPKFKFKDGSTYDLKPQARVGVALKPIELLLITVDCDVTRNQSGIIAGLKSQQIGGGVEIAPDWAWFGLAIRAGIEAELEDVRSGGRGLRPEITAGFGVHFGIVHIDVGAAVATKTEEFRRNKVPRDAGVGFQVGLHF